MKFADLHNHTLYSVDDGPKSAQEMFEMLDAAWADGIGAICLTPHFHPGYFGENQAKIRQVFEMLTWYAAKKYPEMRLYLGNELRYSGECLSWLESGACLTLNGTDHVLVDFHENEPERNIVKAMERLMNAGYRPVLAHAERYHALSARRIGELVRNGISIQIDVQSLFGIYGLHARMRSWKLLNNKLVDIVATDAHGLGRRNPILSRGYRAVQRKYGDAYASTIFAENPMMLLAGEGQEGARTNHE